MARVVADITRLDAYVDELGQLDRLRRLTLSDVTTALDRYFMTGPEFGPAASSVPALLAEVIEDARVAAAGITATAHAFRQADVVANSGLLSGWRADDAWIEQSRRAWLWRHEPAAFVRASAPTVSSRTAIGRIEEIDRTFERARDGGFMSVGTAQRLAEERARLAADLLVHVSALTNSIEAWAGSDNDRLFDALVTDRDRAIGLLFDGDSIGIEMMGELVSAGVAVENAYVTADEHMVRERRLAELVAAGNSRVQAETKLEEMDSALGQAMERGYSADEATVAWALADRLDIDLGSVLASAEADELGIVDALGRMAMADVLDVDVAAVDALRSFREHFAALDTARGGASDDRVSEADLLHVVANADAFHPSQVLAAEAILAEPILRHRLDTASSNGDVIDSDSFGSVMPDDRVISLEDIESFVARSFLNDLLDPYRLDLDTAAEGGTADGWFSQRDLESWLSEHPDAPDDVRAGVSQMLDSGLVDRSWLEVNREALAMGAAVVAGGAIVVATGGTALPGYVVLGSGFAAGGAAAGATTIAVNHRTGRGLGDGVLSNSLNGAMIGISVAGLPGAWTKVVANGTTITVRSVGAASVLTAEVSGVVASGGVDLVLPQPWESPVRRGASATEKVAGLVAATAKK